MKNARKNLPRIGGTRLILEFASLIKINHSRCVPRSITDDVKGKSIDFLPTQGTVGPVSGF